jgi:hypothetical protein
VLIVNAYWQGVPECLVYEAEVGVAAVGIPSGEGWRGAQVLRAAPAEPTAAVGAAKPRDSDSVSDRKPSGALPERVDYADHLMARRDVRAFREQVPLGQVQIGATDSAAGDPHSDLPAKRDGHLDLSPLQRPAVDWPRLMHDPGVHHAILTTHRPSGKRECLLG